MTPILRSNAFDWTDGGARTSRRAAVLAAPGVDYREAVPSRALNWWCSGGAGAFLINRAAPLRQKAFEIKMAQVEAAGAQAVAMSCGSCRLNFMSGTMQAQWNRSLVSLVERVAEHPDT